MVFPVLFSMLEAMRVNYKPPVVVSKALRQGKTVPDQAMSIKEIVARFTRGIPVDVRARQGVFIDSSEDLEKLSRMDFGEKAAYADELSQRANELDAELKERARKHDERKRKAARPGSDQAGEGDVPKDDLDDTLAHDTDLEPKKLGSSKGGGKK